MPRTQALIVIVACLLSACSGRNGAVRSPAPDAPAERGFTILAMNDVYRITAEEGEQGGLARLRTLRRELEAEAPDLLMLHAGDLLSPSLLSRRFYGAQMIDILNLMDGDILAFDPRLFITFGNHEFDQGSWVHAPLLEHRLEESDFRWLKTNIEFSTEDSGLPMVGAGKNVADTWLVESGGVKVGLFGLTIDSQKAEYIERFLDPVETARRATAELRQQGAEVVVGLTHLQAETDVEILRQLGAAGPDLIIGGHDHEKLDREVAGRRVIKADADARTVAVVRVTPRSGGPPAVAFHHVDLGPETPAEDPLVAVRAARWHHWFDEGFCLGMRPTEAPGCISTVLGRAGVDLIAEELEIRRFETNFGDWLADLALGSFDGAQAAILNAGGLRLNQDIPAGNGFTRGDLEALLPFPTQLVLMEVPGAVLQQVIERAVEDWTGSGHFLQIAGFAYRHDPETGTVDRLTLLPPQGPRPVAPDEEIRLVVPEFLADPGRGQDGYTMLEPRFIVDDTTRPDLRRLVRDAFDEAREDGIRPRREGRICTVGLRQDPCLAVPPAPP